MSTTSKRILVSIIIIPAALAVVWFGGLAFDAALLLLAAFSLSEFYAVAARKNSVKPSKIGLFFGFVLTAYSLLFFARADSFEYYLVGFIIFGFFFFTVFAAELIRGPKNSLNNAAGSLMGLFYAGLPYAALKFLRNIDSAPFVVDLSSVGDPLFPETGRFLTATFLFSVWACDTSAYFIGKKFGKRKLAPKISPHKTREGAAAGLAASIVVFTVFSAIFFDSFPIIHSIALGAIVGVFGQFGDLSESLFKRDASAKDSSRIIPGHGGALDRMDSTIFAAPAAAIYTTIFLSGDSLIEIFRRLINN